MKSKNTNYKDISIILFFSQNSCQKAKDKSNINNEDNDNNTNNNNNKLGQS